MDDLQFDFAWLLVVTEWAVEEGVQRHNRLALGWRLVSLLPATHFLPQSNWNQTTTEKHHKLTKLTSFTVGNSVKPAHNDHHSSKGKNTEACHFSWKWNKFLKVKQTTIVQSLLSSFSLFFPPFFVVVCLFVVVFLALFSLLLLT